MLVQLLHFATPLMPYKFYCRNWDFGYGHYNGFGARLVGVFFAWAWLRHDRLHAFDWAGLAALAIFTYKVPGSRGAFGGMAVLFVLFFVQRLLPRLFDSKIFYGLALALPVALAVFSLYAGYVYNPEWPYERMALLLLSIALSGRFEIWHNVFWSAPLSLLGGLPPMVTSTTPSTTPFGRAYEQGSAGRRSWLQRSFCCCCGGWQKSIAPPRSSAW